MPSISNPLGALPARFRRPRLLVVGCGDVGLRLLQRCNARFLATTSTASRVDELRRAGAVPLVANLDDPKSLRRLAGLAQRVIQLAPPPGQGAHDPRTHNLLRALMLRSKPRAFVYASTTGVYGNCNGEWVDETRATNPQSERAKRRVHAESTVRWFGRAAGVPCMILRIPGIYAPNREGGTPRERLLKGSPVLIATDDVYTNHIHADDLARACALALWRGKPQRVLNVCDNSSLKMGDYMDAAADLYQLPRPPKLPRDELVKHLSPMQLSFMAESRRLRNDRMVKELRLRLFYPDVVEGLRG